MNPNPAKFRTMVLESASLFLSLCLCCCCCFGPLCSTGPAGEDMLCVKEWVTSFISPHNHFHFTWTSQGTSSLPSFSLLVLACCIISETLFSLGHLTVNHLLSASNTSGKVKLTLTDQTMYQARVENWIFFFFLSNCFTLSHSHF